MYVIEIKDNFIENVPNIYMGRALKFRIFRTDI